MEKNRRTLLTVSVYSRRNLSFLPVRRDVALRHPASCSVPKNQFVNHLQGTVEIVYRRGAMYNSAVRFISKTSFSAKVHALALGDFVSREWNSFQRFLEKNRQSDLKTQRAHKISQSEYRQLSMLFFLD